MFFLTSDEIHPEDLFTRPERAVSASRCRQAPSRSFWLNTSVIQWEEGRELQWTHLGKQKTLSFPLTVFLPLEKTLKLVTVLWSEGDSLQLADRLSPFKLYYWNDKEFGAQQNLTFGGWCRRKARWALRLPGLIAAGSSQVKKGSSNIYIVFRFPFNFPQTFMSCLQTYNGLCRGFENLIIIIDVLLTSSEDVMSKPDRQFYLLFSKLPYLY